MDRFAFAFSTAYRLAAAPFGITAHSAWVEIDRDDQPDQHAGQLIARFGPWRVRTGLTNVLGATITGPYRLYRTMGPARLSLADRGLTMATNQRRGVCIQFAVPVAGIEPTGRLRHPNLTVTVAEFRQLVEVLTR